jgi:hypothetical protein
MNNFNKYSNLVNPVEQINNHLKSNKMKIGYTSINQQCVQHTLDILKNLES